MKNKKNTIKGNKSKSVKSKSTNKLSTKSKNIKKKNTSNKSEDTKNKISNTKNETKKNIKNKDEKNNSKKTKDTKSKSVKVKNSNSDGAKSKVVNNKSIENVSIKNMDTKSEGIKVENLNNEDTGSKNVKKENTKNVTTKNKNLYFILIIIFCLVMVIGFTYSTFTYNRTNDSNTVAVVGDIYMHYNEGETITLTNIKPMSKKEALAKTDNIFNFQITGKNTSDKDIYYGISLEQGSIPAGKTSVLPSDLVVYLESDNNILVDGVRYQDFLTHIYVDKIPKGTTNEIEKNYNLRVWLREGVIVSDTLPSATYTTDEWANLYMSLKLKVDGNLNSMNMPLSIEHDNASVSNSKQYIITTVKNFLNPDEAGEILEENEKINLEVTSDSSDILFSYKDSRGNSSDEPTNDLSIDYTFNKKESVETQIFITPLSDTTVNSDIIIKQTSNDNQTHTQVINMDIKGTNYCLSNNFNKLSDCILVSENLSSDVDSAKEYISTKNYNLNNTAPSYTYVEQASYDVENPYYIVYEANQYNISSSINFNTVSGNYDLVDEIKGIYELTEEHEGLYTCGAGVGNSCSRIVKILEVENNKIVKGDVYTINISSVIRSEDGLYQAEDDYGNSYFYRGAVLNNNVYFGGYYWKIVRINGDNSIRMVYNGSSPEIGNSNAKINNANYAYSVKFENSIDAGGRHTDPTFVGYMYGDEFSEVEVKSGVASYGDISAPVKYYFSDQYEYNPSTQTFKLTGNNIQNKTYKEMNDQGLFSTYPYTCVNSKGNWAPIKENCQVIMKINTYVGETSVRANYISYSSTSVDNLTNNKKDSNAKIVIDDWYSNHIVGVKNADGNFLTDYIVDGTFCNNRTITSGNVYNLAYNTTFSAYNNLYTNTNKSASLKCDGNPNDKFSTTSSYGNQKLTYPIALLTADEIALAGAVFGLDNKNFYLNSNFSYWTMTPAYYDSWSVRTRMVTIGSVGNITIWYTTTDSYGIRPVINISKDVLIASGDGSYDNPFELKLR